MTLVGVVLWILETWYFGWNAEAGSVAESILDTISTILIVWGVLGDIFSGMSLTITKNVHNKYDVANAEKMIVNGQNINYRGKE